ncbi:TetR/AcrR family transcriptional regulator [Oleiphilus messinensis]|nr:TetR/AcrR family transcriptional regulator [Oleiphilus messinensis]
MTIKRTLSAQKRLDILSAAIKAFQENGFQATSMDQIALKAGVSKRTVYNHFNSKEALFTEITDKHWQQTLSATAYHYQSDRPLREQLVEIAKQELSLFESENYIGLARMIISEYIHSPELAKEAMLKISSTEGGLRCWLQAAIDDQRLKEVDTTFATHQFLNLLKAFAFWPQVIGHSPKPGRQEAEEVITSAVDMFLGYYDARA